MAAELPPIALVLQKFGAATVEYIPNVVSAIILLVIGLIAGKIVGRVVKEVLQKMNLDRYLTETKKPPFSPSDLLSVIIKWWIYLVFITAALSKEVLGITTLAEWMSTISAFIPRIVGAAIIIVVGYILGEYIQQQIRKTETFYAALVGKITLFFILYVAIAIALPVLGVSATLVNNILLVIIGSIGLGMAIAIGLGLKAPIEMIAKRYLQKSKYMK